VDRPKSVIVGAGPAGLTAAYQLSKNGCSSIVLESDDTVGGIARTCEYKGYRFDIGGHRFFTKIDFVWDLWKEILDDEFLKRPRLSRIYYRQKFFDYPLKPANALLGLGPIEAARIGFSYVLAQVLPHREEVNFEQWVTNRFGKRLFRIFFKTYTEKVWGMPCEEISADWAAQRIKNLDLLAALRNSVFSAKPSSKGDVITSLIDEFHYPRHGPGQMWEDCRKKLENRGTEVLMQTRVVGIRHEDGRVLSMRVRTADGDEHDVNGDQFISSMPLRTLIRCLEPPPPPEVVEAAESLRYRDFLTVALVIDREDLFPDNWIYIHSDDVKVGRIQNFKNWSPEMVPDPSRTVLGLEYFVQENDEVWSMDDADLIALGRREIAALNLASADDVIDGTVVRMPKAYPVYDGKYQESLRVIREWLSGIENLQLIGRNGQHRYNNQDHSMVTAVYASQNIMGENRNIWDVNVEDDYHEEHREVSSAASSGGDRLVPGRVARPSLDEALGEVFAKYDAFALGSAIGSVAGGLLFLATAMLLIKGGDTVGPNLSLLGNYLLGYQVSWGGAFLGLFEAGLGGFAFGWVLASMINRVIDREERVVFDRVVGMRTMNLFEGDER
jgi:protoporphyrinogen oxidase